MNIAENLREGVKAIKANTLRTVLTATIVAVGIMALIAILTAIDGMMSSIDTSFSNLGANTFDIQTKQSNRGTFGGIQEKSFKTLKHKEVIAFKENFDDGVVTLHAQLSGNAEVKRFSKKTNPNINVTGIDEEFMIIRDYNIEQGRNFNEKDIQYNTEYVIIGPELVKSLFKENENPLNEHISLFGSKFKVIGVLESKGGLGGQAWADRTIFMPLGSAKRLAQFDLWYTVTATINDPTETEKVIGNATGLMRKIRRDQPGAEESFEIKRNKTVEEELKSVTGIFNIGGIVISMVILLGACIGLMNIMLVSVTERTREIGIRKALGATPQKIREQFLFEALVICLLGGAAGIILGLIAGNVVAFTLPSGKFVFPFFWITVGLFVCILVGIIAGLYPAIKASKLDPIESLRYE